MRFINRARGVSKLKSLSLNDQNSKILKIQVKADPCHGLEIYFKKKTLVLVINKVTNFELYGRRQNLKKTNQIRA